jgi:hypothetical protein
MIAASDWRPVTKDNSSLRGFCALSLSPSGILLHGAALHERGDRRWVALPGRPQLDAEGRHRKDPTTGKPLWTPVVEIRGKDERERFQAAALAAIDKLLDRGSP